MKMYFNFSKLEQVGDFTSNNNSLPVTATSAISTKYRIDSIDILRGLIMLIMAIDHTRDFFHLGSPDPTNLSTTTPILFFTRWITHFCAALFVFLSGISINIAGGRQTKKQSSLFLIQRGCWLILVEIVLITFAITFDPLYHFIILQVIWAIGVSMVLMGILVWLPFRVIAIIACLLFFGHDALTYIDLPSEGTGGFLWKLFFTAFGSVQQLDQTHVLFILYAVLPWTGVMLAGYTIGAVYKPSFDKGKRSQILLISGISLMVLFAIFRFWNIYGDPNPWHAQQTTTLSIISFFNVSKYPPSLMYLCMTISPGLVLLSMIEGANNAFSKILKIFGNVPFFYYVLHFYLLRIINVIVFYIMGYQNSDIISADSISLFHPKTFGVGLPGVYGLWLLVIALLYFPCRWFSHYKKNHTGWWLSYI
jgi:uncharacterized membrane protein